MSALDKLRSFAGAREPDSTPIRDGLTYGDARELLAQLAECAAGPWSKPWEEVPKEDGLYLVELIEHPTQHWAIDEWFAPDHDDATWCEFGAWVSRFAGPIRLSAAEGKP